MTALRRAVHARRSYYHASLTDFMKESISEIVGALTRNHPQELRHDQTRAWEEQIRILQRQLKFSSDAHIFFEFLIPRMGKRADVILITGGVIFVMEFKVGADKFDSGDKNQALSYALDLKSFHTGSHGLPIVPVLVSTKATQPTSSGVEFDTDQVSTVILSDGTDLQDVIARAAAATDSKPFDAVAWAQAEYRPAPTIIEAAQALYAGHDVRDISRSDAGAEDLSTTSRSILDIIHRSRINGRKSICFVTGVPGAGKTLVGLNVATSSPPDENAVFLSGKGPLVDVLREALAQDENRRNGGTKDSARRKVRTYVQNIHHFRDEALTSSKAPPENVVVFDEAQRAWDAAQTSKFMRDKRGQTSFAMSEPEFLISIMDRHEGWCTIVALIGGGQEINTGEAGLQGWVSALRDTFPDWDVYASNKINQTEFMASAADFVFDSGRVHIEVPALHLATSQRSFRADKVSHFVHHLIHNNVVEARRYSTEVGDNYPLLITRNLATAKAWARERTKPNESKGVIASSGGYRLQTDGIYVKNDADPRHWFLAPPGDVRSSDFLESTATEFDVQGLELDWAIVGWDLDYRHDGDNFQHWSFRGTSWQRVKSDAGRRFLENSYRVLLTRARQGLVIFVPEGDPNDATRSPHHYDLIYDYLLSCGFAEVAKQSPM